MAGLTEEEGLLLSGGDYGGTSSLMWSVTDIRQGFSSTAALEKAVPLMCKHQGGEANRIT